MTEGKTIEVTLYIDYHMKRRMGVYTAVVKNNQIQLVLAGWATKRLKLKLLEDNEVGNNLYGIYWNKTNYYFESDINFHAL